MTHYFIFDENGKHIGIFCPLNIRDVQSEQYEYVENILFPEYDHREFYFIEAYRPQH